MLIKSGLFLFLLTVLQVSARYKSVEPGFIESENIQEPRAVSSSSSRIISGWEAQPGQIPYQASLYLANGDGIWRCGGSIVSKDWVITAASCIHGTLNIVVRAGLVHINNHEYIVATSEWYRHPEYNSLTPSVIQPNDIALVKLREPVVYTKMLQPIRIQSSADAYRDYDGEQVFTSGFGNIENSGPNSFLLRWVYLRAISNNACARASPVYSNRVFDTTICAQYFNVTSQSTCSGDEGGPLVHVGPNGIPTLIGVSQFFSSGCDLDLPSGFTRPGPYLSWFKEVTGIDFETLQEDGTTIPTTSTTTPASTTTTTTPYTSTTTTTTTTSTSSTTTTPTSTTTAPSTSTTTTTTTMTTESEQPTPEDFTTEEITTAPPEDSEDEEEDTKDEEDSSESNEDDGMAQFLKRLEVNVRSVNEVKIGVNKYMSKDVGKEISVWKK